MISAANWDARRGQPAKTDRRPTQPGHGGVSSAPVAVCVMGIGELGPLLTAALLEVGYTGGPTVVAAPELVLSPRELVALVGDNGAGKSTLLRSLAGLLAPRAGQVVISGHSLDSVEARRELTYLSDTPVFYDGISVGENLDFVARLNGIVSLRQHTVVDHLGVRDLLGFLPTRLSRGQRQRAALTLVLARPWRVALLDEPLTGLDATTRVALVELLGEFCQSGRAVLAATHDPEVVSAADRVIAVADGRLGPGSQPVAAPR